MYFDLNEFESPAARLICEKYEGKTLEEVIEANPAGFRNPKDVSDIIAKAYWAQANNNLPVLLELNGVTAEEAAEKYYLDPELINAALKGEKELPNQARYAIAVDIEYNLIQEMEAGMPKRCGIPIPPLSCSPERERDFCDKALKHSAYLEFWTTKDWNNPKLPEKR